MQNCFSLWTSRPLAIFFIIGVALFASTKPAAGVTLGTNETFAYIKVTTPASDIKKTVGTNLMTQDLTVTFSNRLAVADVFGSAEGYLSFTNTTTLAEGELRSVKLIAAGGGAAQGSSAIPNGGHGAFASVGLFHALTF